MKSVHQTVLKNQCFSTQGQSAFDVADNSLLRLMDELKKKQAALKLVNQNKQVPRKRK